MALTYGLTPTGFVAKPQQQIISEIQSSLRTVFGQNINLAPESNFGQLVGIFSEREALIWQLMEAVYSSQYPGGAEGTSVDNILALLNLRRLGAKATRTDDTPVQQANSITLYGLVLLGTAGVVIPQGSIVQTSASPPQQFKTDAAVTIGAAVNDIQSLYLSNTPTIGTFAVSISDTAGNTLFSPLLRYDVLAAGTKLLFSAVPSTGAFALALSMAGVISTTGSIPFTANAGAVQFAIQALTGYAGVTVTGDYTTGFVINWNGVPNPLVSFAANTLGVTVSVSHSLQAGINSMYDSLTTKYPYTDVVVSGAIPGFTITFGAGPVAPTQPSSAKIAQALMQTLSNTMMMGPTVTNLKVVKSAQGAPSQAIATATCTVTGPIFVAAGSINTIGTSITGWTGVTNQLDCLTGRDAENDTQALVRAQTQLQSNANGPLQSIEEKVGQLVNVSAAIGFENLNEAALQLINFASLPVSGQYRIRHEGNNTAFLNYNATSNDVQNAIRGLPNFSTALVTGDNVAGFTVDFNGSEGGQDQALLQIINNTTAVAISVAFGRPGHSFEIVAEGGSVADIVQQIFDSKPAGIQTFGNTSGIVFDSQQNAHQINFSRPTPVPIYVTINMVTDLNDHNPQFNPNSVLTIQEDIVNIGKLVGIGGLVIGFGTEGLIGAFNAVLGVKHYTMTFGRSPNPSANDNIQMQPEEVPDFQSFNITVSYT